MTPRSPEESHRAATPLELFFDLVFVVAIAQAASGLHHALVDEHAVGGLIRYAMTFFAIWWAWMNFTWFASAYDSDDVPYRLLVFVQLTGALILAAGIGQAFADLDFRLVVTGYVVMRIAMVLQWLRAARADSPRRRTAFRYATGIAVLQVCWVALMAISGDLWWIAFAVLVALELAVPMWAESGAPTPWHPHHIAERYGLLAIIVLGESVLAATVALQAALAGGETLGELWSLVVGGLLTLFAMWWLYFDRPVHDLLTGFRCAFLWGYGHYLIYAAVAAVGAGLAVGVDVATGHGAMSRWAASATVAMPVALYVACVWFLHRRPLAVSSEPLWLAPAAALLILLTPWLEHGVLATGLVLVTVVGSKIVLRHRAAATA